MKADPRTDQLLRDVQPILAQQWKNVREAFYDEHGLQIKVTEGYRSYAKQWEVYSQGRLKEKSGVWIVCDEKKVVSHAKPGSSWHQFGLALDTAFLGSDPYLDQLPKKEAADLWQQFGALCKKENLEWGGDWEGKLNDRPHCQNRFGLTLHNVQIIYEDKGLRGIFEECNKRFLCGREIE